VTASATRRCLLGAILSCLVAGAGPAFAGELKLGSGRSVDILSVGPLQSTKGWSALMLKYRTTIPFDQEATLRQEVDEIWDRLVVDAERGGYQSTIISATGPETGSGMVTKSQSFNFAYEKRNGDWRASESKERVQAKLDRAFVADFMGRVDWAYEHRNFNTLMLYLATDWTATFADPSTGSETVALDRTKFMTMVVSADARDHKREILSISVADDGLSARIESRETERTILKDREIATVGRSTDAIALQGNSVVILRSAAIVEKKTETRSN
jgi:hypothetical protein